MTNVSVGSIVGHHVAMLLYLTCDLIWNVNHFLYPTRKLTKYCLIQLNRVKLWSALIRITMLVFGVSNQHFETMRFGRPVLRLLVKIETHLDIVSDQCVSHLMHRFYSLVELIVEYALGIFKIFPSQVSLHKLLLIRPKVTLSLYTFEVTWMF